MGKVFLLIVAVVASLALVESLSCNQCTFSVGTFCFNKQNVSCTGGNTSVCFTGTATFPSLSSFSGFNSQGCQNNNTGCGVTTTSTLLNINYNTQVTCCSTNNCNPTTVSSASTAKMSFTGAVGAAILASVLGGMMK